MEHQQFSRSPSPLVSPGSDSDCQSKEPRRQQPIPAEAPGGRNRFESCPASTAPSVIVHRRWWLVKRAPARRKLVEFHRVHRTQWTERETSVNGQRWKSCHNPFSDSGVQCPWVLGEPRRPPLPTRPAEPSLADTVTKPDPFLTAITGRAPE